MRFSYLRSFILLMLAAACNADQASTSTQGQGGSMTRFAISGSHLYLVDDLNIKVFGIGAGSFEHVNDVPIGFGLETIFANGEYLYLGANDAMYIYSITNPAKPSFIFRYSHIVSCDPVVVQGNRAYVTLRSGNGCNRGTNALEILDITNRNNPSLIANYPMQSPHGLGVDGNWLFICEGEYGLKMFDISNEHDIKLVSHKKDIHSYDVIARSGNLILTGEDGVFQMRYEAATSTLEMISKIPVVREDV